MPLSISYRLTGLGWAECTVTESTGTCTVSASYLSDALRSLVLAATATLSRFSCLSFSFDEEPGEYRWVLSASRLNEFDLHILSFPELWGDKPDAEGTLLFRTVCTPETFASAVHAAAASVLAQHGEKGYREKWAEHGFPMAQFNELSRLLSALQNGV